MITIELPWIDSALLPNRADGRNWHTTSAAKKAAREAGYYAALQAVFGVTELDPNEDHALSIVYHPANLPGPDWDNFSRAMKPTLDGIAKALKIDDRHFNPVEVRRGAKVDGGRVTVIIDDVPF
jgi:crossover junction endodeoxyribonuclease RusA